MSPHATREMLSVTARKSSANTVDLLLHSVEPLVHSCLQIGDAARQ